MIRTILAVAALVAAFGIVGHSDYHSQKIDEERYCEMVKLWHQDAGRSGWPPYRGDCDD